MIFCDSNIGNSSIRLVDREDAGDESAILALKLDVLPRLDAGRIVEFPVGLGFEMATELRTDSGRLIAIRPALSEIVLAWAGLAWGGGGSEVWTRMGQLVDMEPSAPWVCHRTLPSTWDGQFASAWAQIGFFFVALAFCWEETASRLPPSLGTPE